MPRPPGFPGFQPIFQNTLLFYSARIGIQKLNSAPVGGELKV
jgi:hypothetical protein